MRPPPHRGLSDSVACCGYALVPKQPPRKVGSIALCPLHGQTMVVAVGVHTTTYDRRSTDRPPAPRPSPPKDPSEGFELTHRHLLWWRSAKCEICLRAIARNRPKPNLSHVTILEAELIGPVGHIWTSQRQRDLDHRHRW